MKLHEMKDESGTKSVTEYCDPCTLYLPLANFGGGAKVVREADVIDLIPEVQANGQISWYKPVTKLLGPAPGHHMIVEDEETGIVSRMVMNPDNHLGAIED